MIADESGAFSYRAILTIGPGPAVLGSDYEGPGENILEPGITGDGFCRIEYPEGEIKVLDVSATLLNPELAGTMIVSYQFCGEDGLRLETRIQPAGTPWAPPSTLVIQELMRRR